MEPAIARISDYKMALSRDEATIFIDSEGCPTQKSVLTWTDLPTAMGRCAWNYFSLHCRFHSVQKSNVT